MGRFPCLASVRYCLRLEFEFVRLACVHYFIRFFFFCACDCLSVNLVPLHIDKTIFDPGATKCNYRSFCHDLFADLLLNAVFFSW